MHRPKWTAQLRALTAKNARLIAKKPLLLLMAFVSPLIVFPLIAQLTDLFVNGVISGVQNDSGTATDNSLNQAGTVSAIGTSSKIYFMSDSVTSPTATMVINRLSEMTGLQMGANIVSMGTDASDYDTLAASIFTDYNLQGLSFLAVVKWGESGNDLNYTIQSLTQDYDIGSQLPNLALQQAIDAAILSCVRSPDVYSSGLDSYQVSYDFFTAGSVGLDTLSDLSVDYGDTTTLSGTLDVSWFSLVLVASIGSLSFVPVMVIVIEIISKEKQRRLLGVLRRMGLMESAFWLSIMIPMTLISVLVALAASVGVTLVYDRSSIFRVTFDVLFIIHFCYAMAMAGFGCLVASVFSRPLFYNLSIGMVALASIAVNVVMFLNVSSDGNVIPPKGLWFTDCEALYAKVLLFIFAPFFNYGRIWADISIINNNGVKNPVIPKFDIHEFLSTTRYLPSITSTSMNDASDVNKFHSLYPTVITALLLLLSPVLNFLLAWYLNQALLSVDGFSRGALFPFTASFWTGKSSHRELIVGDTLAIEKEKSRATNTMRIIKLSKAYKGVSAVKEFSGVFDSGKVYSILGHNGAGKSTLINMLSLGTTPTHGDCFMFGMDMREDTNSLQNMMALCPQFDILYTSLTPNQHLKLYYDFRGEHKGVSKKKLKEIFAEKLAAVNLENVADVPCSRFSGGMKRRLSLCLATVAESAKIVFLDEPTTGLDPISRRGVWKVIQDLKKDRIVILTTHSMHEADALGDHVCIMHQGRLRASGSSLFLKSKFGEGYQLTLVNREKADGASEKMRATVEAYVKFALPRSSIVSASGGALTVAVNKIERGRLVAFLRALKKDMLMDWSIGNSTLEEVFLKLSAQNKEVVTDTEDGQNKSHPICRICAFRPTEVVHLYTKSGVMIEIPDVVCKHCGENSDPEIQTDESTELVSFAEFAARFATVKYGLKVEQEVSSISTVANGKTTFGSQVGAIIIKNIYLHQKEKRVNICFIIFLILFIVISVLAGKLFPSLPADCTTGTFFFLDYSTLSCQASNYSLLMQDNQYSYSYFVNYGFCSSNAMDCVGGTRKSFALSTNVFSVNAKTPEGESLSAQYFDFGTAGASLLSFSGAPANIQYTQTLAFDDIDASTWFVNTINNNLTTSSGVTPGAKFAKLGSGSVQSYFTQKQQQLVGEEKLLIDSCTSYTATQSTRTGYVSANFIDFATEWNQFYPDVGYNVQSLRVGASAINISFEVVTYPWMQFPPIYLANISELDGSNLISSQFSDCVAVQHGVSTYTSGVNPGLESFDAMMVSINSVTNKALKALNTSKTVVANTQTLPELFDIDTTSDSRLIGYKLGRAVYVMFFILTTAMVFPRLVSLLVLEKKENLVEMMRIQGLGLSTYWVGNFIYGFSVIFLFNFLYVIICYFGGISEVILAGFGYMILLIVLWSYGQVCLSFLIAGVITKPTSSALVSYMIYIAAAGLSPFLMLSVGSAGFAYIWSIFPVTGAISIVQLVTVLEAKDFLRIAINSVIMLVSSSFWALLGMYIHAIRASAVDTRLDPLLGLSNLAKSNSKRVMNETDIELTAERKDAAVLNHEKTVQTFHATGTEQQPAFDPSEALRVVHLRKEFGKSKVAVHDMTLSFKLGETFGMLGPNGAGKTTVLNMMTGLLKRTSGSIVVGGKAVLGNKNPKVDDIGVTPQFDTVWPDMTVEEHLKFYCRLHGIPRTAITGVVRSIAESIELDGDAFKQNAVGLSGGMRRRLSIGIALTGNPKILVLDEPTTGLDPETRRQIWKIIDKIQKSGDKCVIITTHSMDEADALCSRIGIVVDGSVRVLGSQMSLKKQFAEGLKFTFRFTVKCSIENNRSLAHFENCEKTRIAEISHGIQRATRIGNLKWTLVASDLVYAHANALLASGSETSWMVSLQCVAAAEDFDVADAFMDVSQACETLGVGDWAVNETTLEDVFVKVVEN
ncbi:hypothetical protein HK100_010631 [Physocladia obscura]|uniref:ABC transporter domain-containing protein n=1 Tax=Physocladia obscura TaxID=109957 RepID=A0AAD5XH26_9FUNG|nr:hypothetical protein HK100_010631 [Physocladia obscura]